MFLISNQLRYFIFIDLFMYVILIFSFGAIAFTNCNCISVYLYLYFYCLFERKKKLKLKKKRKSQTTCESSTLKRFLNFPVLTVLPVFFQECSGLGTKLLFSFLRKTLVLDGNSTAISATISVKLHDGSCREYHITKKSKVCLRYLRRGREFF